VPAAQPHPSPVEMESTPSPTQKRGHKTSESQHSARALPHRIRSFFACLTFILALTLRKSEGQWCVARISG